MGDMVHGSNRDSVVEVINDECSCNIFPFLSIMVWSGWSEVLLTVFMRLSAVNWGWDGCVCTCNYIGNNKY